MDAIKYISEPKLEEQPYFFEVKKYMVVGEHPTWPRLTYDPFPDADMEDVVRREIIGRQIIFRAKMEISDSLVAMEIRPGKALNYGEHKFAVEESTIDGAIVDVVGSEFVSLTEPTEIIGRWRGMLAASNPK